MTMTLDDAFENASGILDMASALIDNALSAVSVMTKGGRGIDEHQSLAYHLAHASAGREIARSALTYGEFGDTEARIACVFIADFVADLVTRTAGHETEWATVPGWHAPCSAFLATCLASEFVGALADAPDERHLPSDMTLVASTFRRFAEEQIRPHAEEIHRHNADIPEEIIEGLSELGAFGLSIPEEYEGFATGSADEFLAEVIATEELSRVSLGVGGSLATRPEILARALLDGGTEAQKMEWLPKIASGECMIGIAVTEPDFGSDVASVRTTATSSEGGYLINGVKTWSTFAGRSDALMVLVRTDPDPLKGHRGLSLFVVPKPKAAGHHFLFSQDDSTEGRPAGVVAGRMEGRAIDTIGYRGMHSFEVSFENWWVPEDCLIGGEEHKNKGFYLQMAGFENGRIQTAARALGVMQAAYEAGLEYAKNRLVFGRPLFVNEITKTKLGHMVATIQAGRQFTYDVARHFALGTSSIAAAQAKAYLCLAAERISREAMQLHGGMGYAEEYSVSRYFVDARVLSIFEGTDEILCTKVIARQLLKDAAN